jgi:hypothetical protein
MGAVSAGALSAIERRPGSSRRSCARASRSARCRSRSRARPTSRTCFRCARRPTSSSAPPVALAQPRARARRVHEIQNTLILVGLGALVVAFILSFILARRITGRSNGSSARPRRSASATSTLPTCRRVEGRDRDPREVVPGDARGAAREGRARAVRRVVDDEHEIRDGADGGRQGELRDRRRRAPDRAALRGPLRHPGSGRQGGMGVVYRAHDRDPRRRRRHQDAPRRGAVRRPEPPRSVQAGDPARAPHHAPQHPPDARPRRIGSGCATSRWSS